MKVVNEIYRIRCPHCGKMLEFEIDDIYGSYTRGKENGPGWIDGDRMWFYINCMCCDSTISVDNKISDNDYIFLRNKLEDID